MADLIISTDLDDEDGTSADEQTSNMEVRALDFAQVQPGARLDMALVSLVPEFSRSYLQQLIHAGAVQINGVNVLKASYKSKLSDRGLIELRPTPQSQAFKPEAIALNVLYSDEHLMVLDKAAGMVVHPAPGNWSGTLMNAILAMDEKAAQLPRAGIVHRLDKDTSGLMLVARSRIAMDALVQAIAARSVKRQYIALGQGAWQGSLHRSVNVPIGRDPANRLRMAVVDLAQHAGKLAHTDFKLLATSGPYCLVQCTLQTGRTHQIRVHMSHLGHPLVADATYGGRPAAGLQRQALHAYRLGLAHPVTGQALEFRSVLPPDIQLALAQLAIPYNPSESSQCAEHS
jgi:23S rRNA pseudouridine1911/1915/1917 synthase